MLKLNPFKLLAPFAGSNPLTGVFIDHDYMYATNRYVVRPCLLGR